MSTLCVYNVTAVVQFVLVVKSKNTTSYSIEFSFFFVKIVTHRLTLIIHKPTGSCIINTIIMTRSELVFMTLTIILWHSIINVMIYISILYMKL